MKTVFICEDSMEGIFSGIYEAWKNREREGASGIAIGPCIEPELFCEYEETPEDHRKARAVEQMIIRNLGREVYRAIYYASLADDREKGNAILGTILSARKLKDPKRIMEQLGNVSVEKVFELSRNVGNEAHLFTGFLRFRELENGILFAEISPKNQILPCLAAHFQDRFPVENWMIRDRNHTMYAVHEAGKRWILVQYEEQDTDREPDFMRFSDQEEQMQKLWRGFCDTIAIKERLNPKCQRTNLPLRYRSDMTEFEKG